MLNSWCQCECLETSIREAAFRSLLSLPSNTARWRRALACRRLPTCSSSSDCSWLPSPLEASSATAGPFSPALSHGTCLYGFAGAFRAGGSMAVGSNPRGCSGYEVWLPSSPWHCTGVCPHHQNNIRVGACSQRGMGSAPSAGSWVRSWSRSTFPMDSPGPIWDAATARPQFCLYRLYLVPGYTAWICTNIQHPPASERSQTLSF